LRCVCHNAHELLLLLCLMYRLGLAARLRTLLSRVQSSTRMWQHEANHANVLHSSKRGTVLYVHSVWKEYSHLLVHCTTSSCKYERKVPNQILVTPT